MARIELGAELKQVIESIAEVSEFIWKSGWSASSGGNLSVDVTEALVNDGGAEPCNAPGKPLIVQTPELAGRSLLVTVSGSRFRDIPKRATQALMLMQISESGDQYHVLWGAEGGGVPTTDLLPHLKIHAALRARNAPQKVALHTHPQHLIAMTHLPEYRNPDFVRVLQTSQTTAKVFLKEGVGMTRYMPLGSEQLAERTVDLLRGRRAVIWERHGCVAVGCDVFEAFDVTDLLEKAAHVFLLCVASGYEPKGMTPDEVAALED